MEFGLYEVFAFVLCALIVGLGGYGVSTIM